MWSETDTPEIAGKSTSLEMQHNMTVWCALPPLAAAGYCTACPFMLHVQHACVSDTVRYLLTTLCVELAPSVSRCRVPLRTLCLHAICLPYERFLWSVEERSIGQVYCLCMWARERHCEVIILHKAVVFTGLGLVGRNTRPITTMEMCALPSEVHCGNTNRFHNILL